MSLRIQVRHNDEVVVDELSGGGDSVLSDFTMVEGVVIDAEEHVVNFGDIGLNNITAPWMVFAKSEEGGVSYIVVDNTSHTAVHFDTTLFELNPISASINIASGVLAEYSDTKYYLYYME